MAIQKTAMISRVIFWTMAIVSTVFTMVLFRDFADSVITGILWVSVGLTMELLKLLFLSRWQNAVYLKRKVKIFDPIMYVSLALMSAIASLVFGIGSIDRQALHVESRGSQVAELRMRIADTEERIARYQAPDMASERRSIDRQIDALTKQITNITEHVSERSLQVTAEIQRLQDMRNQLGRTTDPMKDRLITSLSSMRREYATASIGNVAAKGSFETLANVLNVSVNSVMVFFLMFTVVIIEIGMAVTAGPSTAGSPIIAKPKKKTNQLSFTDMIEPKENKNEKMQNV